MTTSGSAGVQLNAAGTVGTPGDISALGIGAESHSTETTSFPSGASLGFLGRTAVVAGWG
ncbi:hypothetical protein J7I85_02720 [Arthrobacter sp. ISL-65]|nr:hypothetical protein [Arthrobacter sp. ISL-65]